MPTLRLQVATEPPMTAIRLCQELIACRSAWGCDFEFQDKDGNQPVVWCMSVSEYFTGRTITLWRDELLALSGAPFPIGPHDWFVAFAAEAELKCFLSLGWRRLPPTILDLRTEFRVTTNDVQPKDERGLVWALQHYGLDHLGAHEKPAMQELAKRGEPFTPEEREDLMRYCARDVDALMQLLPAALAKLASLYDSPSIGLQQAFHRGRVSAATARIETVGTPIDVPTLEAIRSAKPRIRARLIDATDPAFGVYVDGKLKLARFEAYLECQGIDWERTPSGRLRTDEEYFEKQCEAWPQLVPLLRLTKDLRRLRSEKLAVGRDGRNRTPLWPFATLTGRFCPKGSESLWSQGAYLRALARPERGRALAQLDFAGQEIAIAAALSGDPGMIDGYRSGDIYMALAKRLGLAPPEATKQSHPEVREKCKVIALGVLYGMGPKRLAKSLQIPLAEAEGLLRSHEELHPVFWAWSRDQMATARWQGHMSTVFGWRYQVTPATKRTTLLNFPMQSHGAEILRLACCLATEAGIDVCAPVHDSLLIESSLADIEEQVALTRRLMVEAGTAVLGEALELRVDVTIIRWPDRYQDPRGRQAWEMVMHELALAAEEASEGRAA